MKIITGEAILQNYNLEEIIESIEKSYISLKQGKTAIGQRFFLETIDGGDILYGAALNKETHRLIVLGSPFMPWNGDKNLPIVTGYYLLIDFQTGELLSVMNGNDIVRFRTAAKSALALKYLARKDSKKLGFIGMGDQSAFHAEVLSQIFDISEIYGFTNHESKREKTIKYIKEKTGITPQMTDIETIIKEADIICVFSHAKEPLFHLKDLHPGQTVIAGDHAESIDKDIVFGADKVFVDLKSTAENEFGVVKSAMDSGYELSTANGDLTDLVSNETAGRESDDEIILFQSLGVMNENLAVVEYFYDKLGKDSKELEI